MGEKLLELAKKGFVISFKSDPDDPYLVKVQIRKDGFGVSTRISTIMFEVQNGHTHDDILAACIDESVAKLMKAIEKRGWD